MRGLVIGRFQPFHKGHEALIRQAIRECDEVLVVIGSSQEADTERNPFAVEERVDMVRAVFGLDVLCVAVPDLGDPPNYAHHVLTHTGPVDRVYGNDDETLGLFAVAGIDVVRPGLLERETWQASTIRALMAAGDAAWKDAVPEAALAVLEKIEGQERVKGLCGSSGAP